ncbi:MAG: GAF and ANTAR domain-containing protein [Microlunatus sp.]|nr:GAF and ANTAR domain-containing protein [Microlunatus sp.]
MSERDFASGQRLTVPDELLAEGFVDLARLATGTLPLEESLVKVAESAVRVIDTAEGAGLMLIKDAKPQTVVATAEFVRDIDDVQYELGEGPSISAAAGGEVILAGTIGGDLRWPRFGGRVARMHVHSVLSLPLITPDATVGAVSIYAGPKHAFANHDALVGERFAGAAAIVVQNAQIVSETRNLAGRLQAALARRGVIDQAIGIIIARTGVGPRQAFDRLRTISQTEHRKVRDVAERLVEEAVHSARHRPADPKP